MVREDIVGGLKVALSKGATLQQAMQSFYNAGYNKEEIEDAARYVMTNQQNIVPIQQIQPTRPIQQIQQPAQIPSSQIQKTPQQIQIPVQVLKIPQQIQIPAPIQNPQIYAQVQEQPPQIQKVSSYPTNLPSDNVIRHKTSPAKIAMLIILFLILFLLIGALISVFIFKDQLIAMFN